MKLRSRKLLTTICGIGMTGVILHGCSYESPEHPQPIIQPSTRPYEPPRPRLEPSIDPHRFPPSLIEHYA